MTDFEVVDAPANFKSKVWKYFGFVRVTDQNGIKTWDKTKTVCKVCEAQIAYGTGNTTNMFTHLQRKHPKLHEEIEASKSKDSKPSQSVKGVAPSVKVYFYCSIKFSIVLCTSVCQYSSIPLISLA